MGWMKNITVGVGFIIVIGSHIFVQTTGLEAEMVAAHSIINYIGGTLMAIGAWVLK